MNPDPESSSGSVRKLWPRPASPVRVAGAHQAAAGAGQLVDGVGVVLHGLLQDLMLLQHGHRALLVLPGTREDSPVKAQQKAAETQT